MTLKIGIYEHATGENVIREMKADELVDYEAGLKIISQAEEAKVKAQIDKIALFAKLGLTPDEAKLLLS